MAVLAVQNLDPLLFEYAKKGGMVAKTTYLDDTGPSTATVDTGPSTSISGEEDRPCIVGMACRLPGGISSPSDLWEFLYNKKTAQGIVPKDRFNIDGFYHKDNSRAGAMNVEGGYFLQTDVRQFDNSFFGINNLEASYMDPQQRKLLEVVYECFEDAGVTMEEVSGSNTAVYVGNFTVDYQSMQSRDPDYLHRLAATGGGTAIMSNRISHVFNLQGPSLTLDTACSSTIYALHHAVNAIQAGDCDGAIVAGANLITSPEQHLGTAKGGFLSPTSACHTFDSSADGYARAEGVNAIYIRRLSSAIKEGNRIHAVIRGTAINANGKTPGITLPSASMQQTVVTKAYQNAGLEFADTDYIECHGTGTAVGDPIEVEGLAGCFTPREGEPLRIGSVKTNLGHSEAASGLTSIIKVSLAFEHGIIPPTYGVKNLNPKLKLEDRNMKVLNAPEAWPRTLQRASINSFGYGGANGHVILESAQSYLGNSGELASTSLVSDGTSPQADDHIFILPFSASSPSALDARKRQVCDLIEHADRAGVRRLASMMGKKEARLRLRGSVLVKTSPKPSLLQAPDGGPDKAAPGAQKLPFAFVFTGQGAQYAGMGKELLDQNDAFLASIRELDQVLQTLPSDHAPSWTLEETIRDPPTSSKVNDVTRSQPLCTAVQITLVDLLRSWGVTPSFAIGHSSGEIAASYSAGLLTASQAILAAYFRGFAVGQMESRGAMMAAGVTPVAANALIQELGLTQVRVACVNAPESVTISGSAQDIETLYVKLQDQRSFARKLETGGRAYHSHMMVEVGDLYEQLVAPYFQKTGLATERLEAVMYSSVGNTAEDLGAVDNLTDMAGYLRRNLEQPVQFSAALEKLLSSHKVHLIELGPHSALKGPCQQIRKNKDTTPYAPTLVRKEDANVCLKKLAGTLFSYGHNLNWQKVNCNATDVGGPVGAPLPPYPWDYSKPLVWHEPRASVDIRNRKYLRHELLGTQSAAGNDIDWAWRNIMRLSEMPWLDDHKLEAKVVLPGSAYITIAIEALSQVRHLKGRIVQGAAMSFECENVNISAPYLPRDDNDVDAEHTELHTILSQRKISTANSSAHWYEFSISSWASGTTTLHCTGSIRVIEYASSQTSTGSVLNAGEAYEAWGMRIWYEKSREEGLNFGPHFQSLTSLHTDASRISADAIATTQLDPPSAKTAGTSYVIHPITLDACFQAAIMGGTAGNINALQAFVPVFVPSCQIHLPPGGFGRIGPEDSKIHTRMENTGFSTRRVHCTLRQPDGKVAVDMQDVRLQLYAGKAPAAPPSSIYLQRHPCLRIHWKPDILRLPPGSDGAIRDYIDAFAARQSADRKDHASHLIFGALLELAGHKIPRMRVLELGHGCACIANECLHMLGSDTAFPAVRSWDNGTLASDGEIIVEESKHSEFDVLLIPLHDTSQKIWAEATAQPTSVLSAHGIVITRRTTEAIASLRAAGFTTLELPSETLLGIRNPGAATMLQGKEALVVVPQNASSTINALATSLEAGLKQDSGITRSSTVSLEELDSVNLTEDVVCVSLLEMEREFLATMSTDDMNRLRKITDTVTGLVWLTGANMLEAPNPDLTLSSGFSRALILEQPSLRFAVLDVGADLANTSSDMSVTCENVSRALTAHYATDDAEFVQRGGLLYVSRFAPDFELNSSFRHRLHSQAEEMQTATLAEVGPARLSIGQVGMTDTMHFKQISAPKTTPPPGSVDVDLRAISLNAKDIYAMNGRVETRSATTALDFSGIISAVGADVTHVQVGDRVAGLAPNHFSTTERVPAAAVHKLLPTEELTVVPTLLTVYSTALFALCDRANLRKGESVLIHAGAGAFGLAAIAMAQGIGATVYTTVGSQSKRDYLVKEMGVPAENIYNSRDLSFVDGIKSATGGRGVNVIVNSLVGDLMHATWSCIAPFGRFVEIGKRELIDAGKLDMAAFLKSCTFTAFDLSEFFYAEDKTYRDVFFGLISRVMKLYRAGKIKPPPIATFDVADMAQAYRYFNNKDRVGKVVISMEKQQSVVQFAPSRYTTVFDAEKTYLLVGCLGGLGRSLSRWMMARGARKFVFMGRSGCDKPSAQQLVSRLESAGAAVTVVRGDVVNATDVNNAVAACVAGGLRIGGVVQAAMGLQEALFTVMSNKAWHTGIQPKWRGTWNLHNALEGHDAHLDFFLMTSSLSGSCGTATESNYCAANGFLDAFAHWRRAQGKPAISLGLGMISEVGYLHENPEIEAMLLRKGIQPLNEDEFLQVIDYGLAGAGGEAEFAQRTSKALAYESAHILTGLEPHAIRNLMNQGFDVDNGIMHEARTSLLAASLLAEMDAKIADKRVDAGQLAQAAEWAKGVPAGALAMLASEVSAPTMHEAIVRLAKKRFSNLILMPIEHVDERAPLPTFGVDSMLAAEFRTWFYNTFKVDVPFLDIVSPQKSLYNLAEAIEEKMVASWVT